METLGKPPPPLNLPLILSIKTDLEFDIHSVVYVYTVSAWHSTCIQNRKRARTAHSIALGRTKTLPEDIAFAKIS